MIRIVTDYLDESAKNYPDITAFADQNRSVSFCQTRTESRRIASCLISSNTFKKPVAVYLDKSVECLISFMGVAYSGNFYSPIDTSMPTSRIEKIIGTLQPSYIISDKAHAEAARTFAGGTKILIYEDMMSGQIDDAAIIKTGEKIVDTDILYVLFTSGSTGTPK